MSLFDGIEGATVGRSSEYIRPGRYVLRVDKLATGKNRKKENFFVAEYTVVGVIDVTGAANNPKGPHRLGDKVSSMFMVKWDSFLGSVKQLIAALADSKPEEVDEAVCNMAVSDEQPFAGVFLEMDVRNVRTQQDKDFTKPVPIRLWDLEEVRSKLTDSEADKLGIPDA